MPAGYDRVFLPQVGSIVAAQLRVRDNENVYVASLCNILSPGMLSSGYARRRPRKSDSFSGTGAKTEDLDISISIVWKGSAQANWVSLLVLVA